MSRGTLTNDLWLMIFLEMSQNSRQPRLRIPSFSSNTCWRCGCGAVRGIEAIVRWSCLVFHSWRLCHGREKGGCFTIEYRVPYHPSEQIFEGDSTFVLHWNHSQAMHISYAALQLVVPLFAVFTTWYCSYITKCALLSDSISCLFRWRQFFHTLTSLFKQFFCS